MYALSDRIETLLGQPIHGYSVNASFSCPLGTHSDRNPSFSINLEEGAWICFACNERGNLPKLYNLLGERIDPDYRLDALISSVRRMPERSPNFSVQANHYAKSLNTTRGRRAASHFLSERPISPEALVEFSIGFDEERKALSFPYWDDSVVTGIKYRAKDGSKFAPPGSKFGLYNVDRVRGKPIVIIGEGESDALALWSLVKDKGVAVCGTSGASFNDSAWSKFAISFLFARKIILAYDADQAGDRCASAAIRVLGEDKCVRLRPSLGKDWSAAIMAGEVPTIV